MAASLAQRIVPARDVSRAADVIARLTGAVATEQSCQWLRRDLQRAIDYAWVSVGHQAVRARPKPLNVRIRRIERAAVDLLVAMADPDASHEVSRVLAEETGLPKSKDAVEKLRLASRAAISRIRPAKQHRIHQIWFLTKVAQAIVDAGGRFPEYNKNSEAGSWPQVLDALRPLIPANYLNVSPSVLAGWIKKARAATVKRISYLST